MKFDYDESDVVSSPVHLGPDFDAFTQQRVRSAIQVVLEQVASYCLHHFFVLEILPDSVRSHDDDLITCL
jgi:hypothetical protein